MLGRLKFHRLWIWYGLYLVVDNIFCQRLASVSLEYIGSVGSVGQITIFPPLSAGLVTMSSWFWSCWSASILSSVDMLFVLGIGCLYRLVMSVSTCLKYFWRGEYEWIPFRFNLENWNSFVMFKLKMIL